MFMDSSLQRCDAMSLGEWFPTILWIMVCLTSGLCELQKLRHCGPLKELGATHPSTQQHIEEDFNHP